MPLKLSNNAIGTLVSSMTNSSTSVVLAPGQGAKFPALVAGEWFPITVVRASEPTQFEIMHVTARSGDVLTVTRAREGTVAITFSVGDIVEHRLTKDALDRDFVRLGPDSLESVRFIVAADGSNLKATVHADGKEEELARQKDLGTAATRDVGTGANTVAAGDDPRIVNAVSGQNALGTINIDTLGSAQHEGIYYQSHNANATTARGYPITEAGSLIVTRSAFIGCQQMYITFSSGRVFVRGLTNNWNGSNGPWREWREPSIPVGFVYIQYPGEASPSDLFRGTWTLLFNTEGVFFRTEGQGASSFGGGVQGDAIRNITGTIGAATYQRLSGAKSGAFYNASGTAQDNSGSFDGNVQSALGFDASRVVPTASENRPRNRTIRVWKKTAN